MPLSDEAVAVRVTELVDGVIKQLLSVWDKLEPAAFDGSGDGGMLTVSSPASSLSPQPSDGEKTRNIAILRYTLKFMFPSLNRACGTVEPFTQFLYSKRRVAYGIMDMVQV